MDRFASMTAFVQVAETGGFTAAARRLNLSKATISDQIQALENVLGVRLLNRTTRQIGLTEVGREYYSSCVQILQDLEAADDAAGAQHANPRGQLRLYCHQGITRFIAPTINDFLARYPEVSIDLRTGHVFVDLIQEGFDLVITPLPPPPTALAKRRLATLSPMLCCAPAYLKTHPMPQTPADLADHNCLLHPHLPSPDEWHFVDPDGNPTMVRVSGSLSSTSHETMQAAAVAGIGVIQTTPTIVADLLESGALLPVLPRYQIREVEINMLYAHRRHLSCKVRAFMSMLVDHFAEQQRWLHATRT